MLLTLISCNQSEFSYNFITKHNIRVKIGKFNRPSQQTVEDWTWDAIGFWKEHFNKDININNLYAYFEDGQYIQYTRNKYQGIATYKSNGNFSEIYIANGKYKEVKFVFLHELSHIILKDLNRKFYVNEEISHATFNKSRFTERFKYW
jgi:Zn-dependent peptidase ImmA (M78 family)